MWRKILNGKGTFDIICQKHMFSPICSNFCPTTYSQTSPYYWTANDITCLSFSWGKTWVSSDVVISSLSLWFGDCILSLLSVWPWDLWVAYFRIQRIMSYLQIKNPLTVLWNSASSYNILDSIIKIFCMSYSSTLYIVCYYYSHEIVTD